MGSSLSRQLADLDAVDQASLVRAGELTARELVEAAVERIERLNPTLNAVIATSYDRAVEEAGSADGGPFRGVPYLVKDLALEIEGLPFEEGSVFLRGHVSSYTSELARRLRRAGLVVLGKTNTPEFGMAPACEPIAHGATRNPWDLGRSTSGSSGGSAAAVAAGLVPMAHANDLGGSIRYPASACGLFGLKPTRARVPLGPEYGDVIGGWAVEHAVTRSVRDSAVLLDAAAGAMPGDPYPAPPQRRRYADEVGIDPKRLRIGYSSRPAGGGEPHADCVAALEDAVALCEALGHEVVEADLPGLTGAVGEAIGTVFDAATAWIVGYWSRRLRRDPGPEELEPLTRAYLEAGERVTAGRYLLAVEELQRFGRVVAGFLGGLDAWLQPTLSEPPAPLGEITSTPDEPLRAAERGGRTIRYAAVVANITGNPAMSIPLWWNAAGLPIGVHAMGPYGDESTLFRLAGQLERARPWATRHPPAWAGGADFA